MNLFLQEGEVDSNMEKTANQWEKLGFILKDGAVGVERTQQFGSRYTYYAENEVRPLTEDEKLQIKEKAREERRLHSNLWGVVAFIRGTQVADSWNMCRLLRI